MKKEIFENQTVKNILSALAVAGGGFILLNLTFGLYAIFVNSLTVIVFGKEGGPQSLPPGTDSLFLLFIGLISWLIFRSKKIKPLLKAIYMTVPLAVSFGLLGANFYKQPIILFPLSILLFAGVFYFLWRKKQPWIYYYTLILVSLALLIFYLSGAEI